MVREVTSEARLAAMKPDEAAALWTARHSEGLSAHEEELFQDWLGRSIENAEAWADAELAWHAFDEAGDDEILAAMRSHALAAERSSWLRPQLAAAAAVLLVLLASALLFLPKPVQDVVPGARKADQPIVYASAKGQVRVVALPDGSRVTLDAESSMEVSFTEAVRAIRLQRGRAFFDTARNPQRPFSVAAGDREVLALGTRFDVRLRPGELTVTLLEGSVRISAPGLSGSTVLKPGQQFIERAGTALVRSGDTQLDEALGWQQGYVTFNDDTLMSAVAEINRYSAQQLVVRDPAVGRLRVTGRFRSGDAERFARVVGEVHPVDVVRRGPDLLELVRRR